MNDSTKKSAVAVTFHTAEGTECAVDEDPLMMHLTWGDGEVTRIPRLTLENLATAYMWHGAKQKFVDAAAIARNPDTGRSATIADKREAVLAVIARAESGEWFARREGGAGAGTLLLAALMRLYPSKTRAALAAHLEGLTADARRKLERNERVAPVIEQIRTERRLASAKVGDGEDALAAIENL